MKRKIQSIEKSLETINHNSTEMLIVLKNELPDIKNAIREMHFGLVKIIGWCLIIIGGLVGVKLFL